MGKKSQRQTSSRKLRTNKQKTVPVDSEVMFQFRLKRFDWQRLGILITLLAFTAGIGSGYLIWGRRDLEQIALSTQTGEATTAVDEHTAHLLALGEQVNQPDGYNLNISYRDVGPQLVDSGAIDREAFIQLYEQANRPLSESQLAVLDQDSDSQIVLNKQNAYFLLNFFWALGLANQNPILTDGPIMQSGQDQIGRYASTGGWTLASKPLLDIYVYAPIVTLNPAQQERLEDVAMHVYRPCCDNPTYFPDCNHGMAMLGLLELMASQDATPQEMYSAAKYANAFWYPNQSIELAMYFETAKGLDFAKIDSQELVSKNYSSGSGYKTVHQWLADNNMLPSSSGSGSSCGV